MTRLALWAAAFCAWGQSADSGSYRVTLRLPVGGLTAGEEMQIEYRVEDRSRVDPVMGAAPVIRARARSVIGMPAMPGMAKLTEDAHPEGVPGEYGVHPVFPHGGEYELRLMIEPPGAPEFQVQFPLAVGDPAPGGKKRQPPFYAQVRSNPKTPKAGEPADLEISVHSRVNGLVKEFDIQHERPMHFVIVRGDLGEFAHEHPEPAANGQFRLRYAFPSAGEYTLFTDAAPKGAGAQVMPVRLRVAGRKSEKFAIREMPLNGAAKAGSVTVTFTGTKFATGRTLRLDCEVRDAQSGAPVTDLQPYLGALGHLLLVHEDGETFVHSHPDELNPDRLAFLARFPKAGRYRGWVQLQRAGAVLTGSILVEAGER